MADAEYKARVAAMTNEELFRTKKEIEEELRAAVKRGEVVNGELATRLSEIQFRAIVSVLCTYQPYAAFKAVCDIRKPTYLNPDAWQDDRCDRLQHGHAPTYMKLAAEGLPVAILGQGSRDGITFEGGWWLNWSDAPRTPEFKDFAFLLAVATQLCLAGSAFFVKDAPLHLHKPAAAILKAWPKTGESDEFTMSLRETLEEAVRAHRVNLKKAEAAVEKAAAALKRARAARSCTRHNISRPCPRAAMADAEYAARVAAMTDKELLDAQKELKEETVSVSKRTAVVSKEVVRRVTGMQYRAIVDVLCTYEPYSAFRAVCDARTPVFLDPNAYRNDLTDRFQHCHAPAYLKLFSAELPTAFIKQGSRCKITYDGFELIWADAPKTPEFRDFAFLLAIATQNQPGLARTVFNSNKAPMHLHVPAANILAAWPQTEESDEYTLCLRQTLEAAVEAYEENLKAAQAAVEKAAAALKRARRE
jgi:hypothetical protein